MSNFDKMSNGNIPSGSSDDLKVPGGKPTGSKGEGEKGSKRIRRGVRNSHIL